MAYTLCGDRALVAGLADDSTVFLHMDPFWLFTAKPSDKQWTRLHTGHIITTLPFAVRFYCLTETALMVADTTASTNPQLAVAAELGDMGSVRYDQTVKLVDNDGELVLVRRTPRDNNNTFRKGYEAYRVDVMARRESRPTVYFMVMPGYAVPLEPPISHLAIESEAEMAMAVPLRPAVSYMEASKSMLVILGHAMSLSLCRTIYAVERSSHMSDVVVKG
nr:uncharacterized protein LOC109782702 isoform X1 [Aegilops tauschii subsp. strangulata]